MRLIDCDGLINARPEFMNEKVVRDTKYRTSKDRIYAKAWNACNSYWLNTIENTKTVKERQTGEWIKGREISRTMVGVNVQHIEYKDYTCSNCGLVLDNLLYNYDGSPFYKFCPNCGADMRKPQTQKFADNDTAYGGLASAT